MPTTIAADAGISWATGKGVLTQSPAADRDPDLNIGFECDENDDNGFPKWGKVVAVASGSIRFVDLVSTASAIAVASGTPNWGGGYGADEVATAIAVASGALLLEAKKKNWIAWSNIGSLVFTISRGNVAGERPMDWKGWVYEIKKLGNKVVIYGENGVSIMTPAGNAWGYETIYQLGLKGKQAVCGDKSRNWFIDSKGQLWQLGESLELLDYSEYLSSLVSPVMSYDKESGFIYICDGGTGHVYSTKDKSMGSGPTNITGIGSQSGVLYPVAPAAIVTPALELCTDIYDLGTNHYKTVFELQFGTNITGTMQAAMDYRSDFTASFVQTPWKDVEDKGEVRLTALGREIRFRIKLTAYEYCEMDYIKVNGVIHKH